jgi:GntR family transcriptional regulator/MocR family aminotransferase
VRFDLGLGVPDLTHFPWKLWRSLAASRLRLIRGVDNSYISAQGYGPLRDAIASSVRFSRAVHCAPNDVLITNGAQQALHLVAQVMLPPGAVVAMEDPGYPMARSIFLAHGAKVSDVPLDREGIIVERLPRDAKLVYTTPSHQFPTGVVMSYERRVQLLEWARKRGAAIIEDDYDSEFRFDGRLLEALQSIDPSVVIYIGTFSKSLFPGIRLGFAISPQPLRQPLVVAKQLTDWHSPLVTQATAAAFISEGHYMRHVRKVRRVYAERRTRLMTEVDAHLVDWLEMLPSSTGLHFAATFRHGDNAEAFADAALSAGVRMIPMPNGLTFGIGSIEVPQIKEAIKIVRGVASEQCRRDPRREIGRRK